MRRTVVLAAMVVLVGGLGNARADTEYWTTETGDLFATGGYDPDGSPNDGPCEIYKGKVTYYHSDSLGQDRMKITINSNFTGGNTIGGMDANGWRDSYSYSSGVVTFDAGDLYVAYAPDGDLWNPQSLFAIGISDHGNVVQQAYETSAWGVAENVQMGHIYSVGGLTDWATGTYEYYDKNFNSQPPDAVAWTESGLKNRKWDTKTAYVNTYPTLLRNPGNDLGDIATVAWQTVGSGDYGADAGDYNLVIDFAPGDLDLGTFNTEDLYFFWSMECGNDGILLEGDVGVIPEPFSALLFGTGVAAAAAYGTLMRKRRR